MGVEAGPHMLQGEEAPDQEPGAHQEHDRERHLGYDQQLPDPPAVAGAAAAAALQALVGVGPCRPRGRENSEDHGRHAAGHEREEEHRGVQLHVAQPREIGRVQGPERLQCHHREGEAQPPAGQGQEQALGEHLAEQRPAARAERGAEGELRAPRRAAREQQVGHVGAGDQQDQADGAEQQDQRRASVLDDVVLQRDDPNPHLRGGVLGELLAELRRDSIHLRLGLGQRHVAPDPAEHGEEGEVPRRGLLVVELDRREELRVGHEEPLGGQVQPEARWQDPDHLVGDAVYLDRASHQAGVAAVAAEPEPVAEHHHVRPAGHLFIGCEGAPQHRLHAEQREEVGGDRGEVHPLRLAIAGEVPPQVRHARPARRREGLEGLAAELVVAEIPGRDRGEGLRPDPEVVPDHDQTPGVRVRQRPEQHAIHHREDRRGCADAERQGGDRDRGPPRARAQRAPGVPEVARDGHHSLLRASAGSTRVARRAGR